MIKRILLSLLLSFIAWNLFSYFFPWHKYFPEKAIGEKNYEELFSYCTPEISLEGYPMNATEWRKQEEKTIKEAKKRLKFKTNWEITPNYIPESLDYLGTYDRQKLIELLISQGDKINSTHKKSFWDFWSLEKKRENEYNPRIYYDYKGNLILVEKKFAREDAEIQICKCRYNNKGKLIEALFDSESRYARYDGNKQYKY